MESRDFLELGKLNHIAVKQQLYQASDTEAGTASLAARFVLGSGTSKGIPIRLISCRVNSDTATQIAFYWNQTSLTESSTNSPQNLWLNGPAAQAGIGRAQVAGPSALGNLGNIFIGAGGSVELVAPAVIYAPPHVKFFVDATIAVMNVCVTWLWAELPPETF